MRGIERDGRDVERARSAGGAEAEFVQGDIRSAPFAASDVIVLLDVLHYMALGDQQPVLERARDALEGGGTLLLRVADADGSLRFHLTEWGDHAAVLLRGSLPRPLHARPLREWMALLEQLGFQARATPMSEGTPFGNALLVARYDRRGNDVPKP